MKTLPFSKILAAAGALLCLLVTVQVWRGVSANQPMWPLPALYLIEMPAVCLLAAALALRNHRRSALALWAATGALTAFALLGALSVGMFYLPAALLMLVGAVLATLSTRGSFAAQAGMGLLAALAQAAVMLAVVWLGG